MMRLKTCLGVSGLVLLTSAAVAQNRTIYSYDSLGRLEHSERRAPGAGHQTDYIYDAGSNRAAIFYSGAFKSILLSSGDTLVRGQGILSADGRFKLVLQSDSNLALYDENNVAVWHTSTAGSGADLLAMQSDGNLVLYAGGTPIWYTSTFSPGSALAVQIDGNIVVYSAAGPVWARAWCC